MKLFFTMILFTVVFAISFVASSAVHAGTPVSEWDEPEVTVPQCPLYGFLGLRWRWCPSVPGVPASEGSDDTTTVVTTTVDDDDDADDDDHGCKGKCGNDDEDDDNDDNDDKEKRSKSNASNHANERADNNNGKGGKDRDTSKNNDKGTHGNRSP